MPHVPSCLTRVSPVLSTDRGVYGQRVGRKGLHAAWHCKDAYMKSIGARPSLAGLAAAVQDAGPGPILPLVSAEGGRRPITLITNRKHACIWSGHHQGYFCGSFASSIMHANVCTSAAASNAQHAMCGMSYMEKVNRLAKHLFTKASSMAQLRGSAYTAKLRGPYCALRLVLQGSVDSIIWTGRCM